MGRDPGLRTGELAGLQSSGKGLGMAGRDDVLSCCSSSCNLLDQDQEEGREGVNYTTMMVSTFKFSTGNGQLVEWCLSISFSS